MRSELHSSSDGAKRLIWHCPGCDQAHGVPVSGPGPQVWHWNESEELPTLSPSILVRFPWGDPPQQRVCHSFMRDGRLQFLSDCTHALAGQTVDVPEFPVL